MSSRTINYGISLTYTAWHFLNQFSTCTDHGKTKRNSENSIKSYFHAQQTTKGSNLVPVH